MESIKQVKGAVFDLDGTLLDSTRLWEKIDTAFLAARKIALPADYMQTVNSMEFSQAACYTIERFQLQETPQALMREWRRMAREAYAREVPLKPFAKEYLDALIQKGVQIGAATSSTEDLFIPALENNGVRGLFSAVVTTKEAGRDKSAPDVYLKTAERMGLKPPDCAVFEDTLQGLQSARAGGFVTVGVYDEASDHEREAIIKEADIYIRSFSALL
ncbi:MAG: HAD family phosphatase [Oscillospiraceae bacterium]|nr:HAD family phosphatase [Oscillospiraceae bacterium]